MPKNPRVVKKDCESCDQQIPVACKTCPQCSYRVDRHPGRKSSMSESGPSLSLEKENSPDRLEMETTAELGERRRSVRAKRDKPDYYDALDYDSKRQKTPRSDKKKVVGGLQTKSPAAPGSLRRPPSSNLGRATLAWRKDEDESVKKKVKKTAAQTGGKTKEETEEQGEPVLEDIPPEKVFSCAVGLAEINRKLGVVMWKPVQVNEIK